MRATLHPEALDELFAAMAYYESKRKGLGNEFYDEIDAVLGRIEQHPQRYPFLAQPFRRCRTRRFPYKLVYEIQEKCLLVVAVMHDSRRPGYWLDRT